MEKQISTDPASKNITDKHRPKFHFLPEKNWMNDPNGLIQWNGQYHLFYQYNPYGPQHGNIHWGHAASRDLVHWQHLPVALAPTPGGPDEDGCWSGCGVVDGSEVAFLYTGFRGGIQTPCLATASGGLLSLEKYPGNPVIPAPPAGYEVLGFRDHSIWQEGQTWFMLIGSGVRGQGGLAFLYRSPDLRHWEYLHPLTRGVEHGRFALSSGEIWECPSFFSLGEKHGLLVSVWDHDRLCYAAAFTGEYARQRFEPQKLRMFDYGAGCYYAPQTMLDDQGRRLVWGWLQENRSRAAQVQAGWSGVMSLPRRLWLDSESDLRMAFVPELVTLRSDHFTLPATTVYAGEDVVLPVTSTQIEIVLELEPAGAVEPPGAGATRAGIKLCRSPQGEEQTLLIVDWSNRQLVLDRAKSSRDGWVDKVLCGGELKFDQGQIVRLHIFLDASVIEVIANDFAAIASRIYPTRPDSTGLVLFSEGGPVQVRRLEAWLINSIWE